MLPSRTPSRWLLCAALAFAPCTGARAGAAAGSTAGSAAGSAAAKAGAGKKRPPPAQLVVPDALREARERGETSEGTTPFLALGSPDVLEALGPWAPVVGHWVEYYVEQEGSPPARVRLSVLAARPGGRFWLEVVAAPPVGLPMASRLLVHGHPARAADVERMQLYIPGQAVLELPLEDAAEAIDPSLPKAAGIRTQKLGPAQTKVPAGTFLTQRLRVSRGQRQGKNSERVLLYRAPEVPIFHLVKSEASGIPGKNGAPPTVVQLSASGKEGAHSIFPASAPLLEEGPAQPTPGPAPTQPFDGGPR